MEIPTIQVAYPKTRRDAVTDHKRTGAGVREYRRKNNLTVREVAAASKFSSSYVSDLEHGRRNWNPDNLMRITSAISKLKTQASNDSKDNRN